MRSTMMDFPLTVRHIFEHGRTLYGDSEAVTSQAGGARRIESGALADRAGQLAAGLRRLGVEPGDRVATFGWNSQEHQEAYFAIPCMGAVMHTINIRLSAEQIRYIIGHAGDSVIIADASLGPVLGPVLAAGAEAVAFLAGPDTYDEDRGESAAALAGRAEAVPRLDSLAGFRFGRRLATGAMQLLGHLTVRQPLALLKTAPEVGVELLRIGLGTSKVAPGKGDKRSADPAWRDNPFFRATMQTYLALGSGLDAFVDNLGMEGLNRERMRFAAVLLREATAPTNFLATNPAALRRAFGTGGASIARGMVNWTDDLVRNHGMPSMVDRRPFRIGENIAATQGAVIHRTEAFELIQYAAQLQTVYQRPLLVVPPQVNKYYAVDLAPGRSMCEYLLQQGIQVFGISWRNRQLAERSGEQTAAPRSLGGRDFPAKEPAPGTYVRQ